MPLWTWVLILAALIKLPIAALMLWIPFRNDTATMARDASDSSEEDGGEGLPCGPRVRTTIKTRRPAFTR